MVNQTELPISSKSVDAFYCSHVVEHLPEFAVQNLMREAFRCLEKGGVFRISTGPCADLDWQALLRTDKNWWFFNDAIDFKESIEKGKDPMTIYDRWLYHIATARSLYSDTPCNKKYSSAEIAALVIAHESNPQVLWNLLTNSLKFNKGSPGNHMSWWNYDKLSAHLIKAGFTTVRRSGYGQSDLLWMRDLEYFDQTYPQISVYVEATK
ncbi:MAG: methyltransferase domain-containing protein [Candidatus Marinimicrobia bacterium]|nr:methyltransferase domain-containing protein [Candidatus Neomarinimicrobiota bacterium]